MHLPVGYFPIYDSQAAIFFSLKYLFKSDFFAKSQ